MAVAVATEANIESLNGKTVYLDDVQVTGTRGDKLLLHSLDEYGEAFSLMIDWAWGKTDNEVVSGRLMQKMTQLALIGGLWLGNYCGFKAAADDKEPGFLGLTL